MRTIFLFFSALAMPASAEEVTEAELARLFQLGACSGLDQLAGEYDSKWLYAALDIAEFYNDASEQRSAVLEYGRGTGWLEGYAKAAERLGMSRDELVSALKKEMPCEGLL